MSDRLRPVQRHIWIHKDGEIDTQEWIRSFSESDWSLIDRGYKKVSCD